MGKRRGNGGDRPREVKGGSRAPSAAPSMAPAGKGWARKVVAPFLMVVLLGEVAAGLAEPRWLRFSSEVGDGGLALAKFEIATEMNSTPEALVVGASDADSAVDPRAMSADVVNGALPGLLPDALPQWTDKLRAGGAEPRRWILAVGSHAFLKVSPAALESQAVQQSNVGLVALSESIQAVDILAGRPQGTADQLALWRVRMWTTSPFSAGSRLVAPDPATPDLGLNPDGFRPQQWVRRTDTTPQHGVNSGLLGAPDEQKVDSLVRLAKSLDGPSGRTLVVLLPRVPAIETIQVDAETAEVRELFEDKLGPEALLDLTDLGLPADEFVDGFHYSGEGARKISELIDQRLRTME